MADLRPKSTAGLVYSTAHGRMCPGCAKPIGQCTCSQNKSPPVSDGNVRVRLETKGRKGKGVTVVSGVPLGVEDLTALGKDLKQRCGSGGTVKDGQIEIQGDHRALIVDALRQRGWKVKLMGG